LSVEATISGTEFGERPKNGAGFFSDLKEALFRADDGVGAEFGGSLLSFCHSWRVSHNSYPCGTPTVIPRRDARTPPRAIRWMGSFGPQGC
jgi:hypothetical protein